MGKYLQERLKLHKMSKKRLVVFALIGIVIGAIGGLTFAKYYANNSNKGVTAAANYYFSSDVLDEALNKSEQPTEGNEKWKDVYNTDAWEGNGTYFFEVKIQNYQNKLLYNSENLDIEYKITFKLLGEDGGSYSVSYGSGQERNLVMGEEFTVDDTIIKGGAARSDTFTVCFNAPEGATEDYQSPGIQVVAEITGPDFLAKTKTKIGGVLHVGIVKPNYSLEGKFDFISAQDNEWSDTSKATVNSMAAFPYSITYTPGEDNAAHDITISWESSKLQLNKFDENYSNVKTENGTSTLSVLIQPKETLELVFYRSDDFDLEQLTLPQFRALITIVDDSLKSST